MQLGVPGCPRQCTLQRTCGRRMLPGSTLGGGTQPAQDGQQTGGYGWLQGQERVANPSSKEANLIEEVKVNVEGSSEQLPGNAMHKTDLMPARGWWWGGFHGLFFGLTQALLHPRSQMMRPNTTRQEPNHDMNAGTCKGGKLKGA